MIRSVVQSAGSTSDCHVDNFGSKVNSGITCQRYFETAKIQRACIFSSVSVLMGQSCAPLYGASSSCLDSLAQCGRAVRFNDQFTVVLWGPVADSGIRRKHHGSSDVFLTTCLFLATTKYIHCLAEMRSCSLLARGPSYARMPIHIYRVADEAYEHCESTLQLQLFSANFCTIHGR